MNKFFTLIVALLSFISNVSAQQSDDFKDFTGVNSVIVGGAYGPYTTEVTYRIRTYTEDNITKLDVVVPYYELKSTAIGDLSIGSYTVCGLTFDETRNGYYRDYAGDRLTMHFSAVNRGTTTFDSDYILSAAGNENILVQFSDDKVKITNNFRPGSMPFPISAVMEQNGQTAIAPIHADKKSAAPQYNIMGQRISSFRNGIVIMNGKKVLTK